MSKIVYPKIILATILLTLLVLMYSLSTFEPKEILEPVLEALPTPIEKIVEQVLPKAPLFKYIEIVDSCGAHFEGACVNVRSGPSASSSSVTLLRNGVVLKVSEKVTNEGRDWYKIKFDDGLRYPERVKSDWYVAADFARYFEDGGEKNLDEDTASTTKRIIVDRSEQMLYAYDGDVLFMKQVVSTGLDLSPTPRGNFKVYKKTPSRYMQGPLPGISDQYYDLPGVPWNLYFTLEGGVIHGAYWHENFGKKWSHGCVNLPLDKAREIYEWADVGTAVTVRD